MSFPETVSVSLCINSGDYFLWTDFEQSKTSCLASFSLLTVGPRLGFSADGMEDSWLHVNYNPDALFKHLETLTILPCDTVLET